MLCQPHPAMGPSEHPGTHGKGESQERVKKRAHLTREKRVKSESRRVPARKEDEGGLGRLEC